MRRTELKKPEDKGTLSRRQFLSYAIGAVGGLITVTLAAPLVSYFVSPALKQAEEGFVAIAPANAIPLGVPTYVEYEHRAKDGWVTKVESKATWVVTKDGKSFTVFDPHCTHLGCAYSWNSEQQLFLCPCHVGVFDINGNVVAGPPPRPLDRLASRVADSGELLVGAIQRSVKNG